MVRLHSDKPRLNAGVSVLLICNLDIPKLRNGTRFQVTHLGPNVVLATDMTGIARGSIIFFEIVSVLIFRDMVHRLGMELRLLGLPLIRIASWIYFGLGSIFSQDPASERTAQELLDSDSFETEFEASQDYAERINVWQFRAERKLNELTGSSESINDNKQVVRLPKLTIPKFNGDSLYWNSFWNSFRVAIHDNTSLSKVETYNYLKSYLSANALRAIEGFLISDENYDSALEILKNRFGRCDIVIHAHMNKLLNLPPVHRSVDIVKLRHLYDTLEIQVRSLKSLDVKPEAYSPMLISVLLKILPPRNYIGI
ncbi:hypothetical protein AVEN_173140-1 [Araneus ventricosus]|uniref:Uncharacterized protein n=1 Tax=Araneus ventricosus TaxID=182803 RepID=A0A4Y2FMN8_ARAVE|nr:hypothetical protein AVEN_173140-1 [Araneus ventricosus]